MSDTPISNAVATSPGEQLRQAREKAGLSLERVAKDLFLDIQKIKSIELNSFRELGAPVYAKGYLRKYARLVGLAEEDVLRRYALLGDAIAVDPVPASVGMMPEPRRPLPRWVLWLVVVLIVAAGAVTLLNLRSTGQLSTADQLLSQPLQAPGAHVSNAPARGLQAAASPTTAASNAAANAGGALLALKFKFTGNSWVEVYDAQNQPVLYEMAMANSVREITGQPPLKVTLGAADAVALQVNAKDVVIPASHIDAGVAHFVLNAAGALE